MTQQKAVPSVVSKQRALPLGAKCSQVVLEAIEPTPGPNVSSPGTQGLRSQAARDLPSAHPPQIFFSNGAEERVYNQVAERTQAQLDELHNKVEVLDRRMAAHE